MDKIVRGRRVSCVYCVARAVAAVEARECVRYRSRAWKRCKQQHGVIRALMVPYTRVRTGHVCVHMKGEIEKRDTSECKLRLRLSRCSVSVDSNQIGLPICVEYFTQYGFSIAWCVSACMDSQMMNEHVCAGECTYAVRCAFCLRAASHLWSIASISLRFLLTLLSFRMNFSLNR